MTSFDLPALYGAGLLTFLSPCVLPLAPLYLGLLTGASVNQLKGEGKGRLLLSAAGFSAGLTLVFVAMGLAATSFGRLLVGHREGLAQAAGFVIILFGLKSLGVISIPWLDRDSRPWLEKAKGRGLLGGLALGAGFALGWSPCIGPVLGSVLTFTAGRSAHPLDGALYLFVYALGLATPLLLLAGLASRAMVWLSKVKPHLGKFEKVSGALLVAMGLLIATDALPLLQPAVAAPEPTTQLADNGVCTGDHPEGCAFDLSGVELTGDVPRVDGPALVEFVSRTCPICQRMLPVVASADSACKGMGVKTVKIEVDTAEGKKLAASMGVRGVPTFVFVDGVGSEVARLVGEQSLESLEQAMEVTVGAQCPRFRPLQEKTPPTAGGAQTELPI